MLSCFFLLASSFPRIFPRNPEQGLAKQFMFNACPVGRVLDMPRKFTSNEPTERGNFTLQ